MTRLSKAYSYLRCSTPEQLRGDSFRRQGEAADRYARENGLALDDTLSFDDRGVSAFKGANKEAGLGRFLEAVENGTVPRGSYLLVESLDRLSREKTRRALRALEDIVDAGIVVVTLSDRAVYSTQTLDENPVALFQALIVMMRAHEESAMKSSRISRAWEAKRQRARLDGEAMTGRCPAWLRIENKRYVEIPERADLVREIFKRAIEGEGKRAIVAEFRRRGVAPWGRGKVWHESYVQKIIQTEAAFGRFAPLKGKAAPIDGYFPETVSQESYWTAQAARANRRTTKNPVPPGKGNNLFSGLARCECGAGMHYVDKGERSAGPYLVCGSYRTGGGCQNGAKWLYQLIEREIVYFSCFATSESFHPNETARSTLKDDRIAAQERHEAATRRLAALAEAIAAGAGASLATAHAAADLELAKAKEALVAAETAAGGQQLDDRPFPNELFYHLWADKPPTEDPVWRRATAATLRRRLDRIEFRSHRIVAIHFPDVFAIPAIIPFESKYCRLPGEIHYESNAGWFDGGRDAEGRPTKTGKPNEVS